MDAKINIKKRLPSRHVTEGSERAPYCSYVKPASNSSLLSVAEIFKMTPCIADLKLGGRYVAKDMFESGDITILMRTLPDKPVTVTGGVVGLRGNLAPEGAIVKVAGMSNLRFNGPARCFDREEDALEAVQKRTYKDGEVIVIRQEGPRGGSGMREMLPTAAALTGQVMGGKIALMTDAVDGIFNVKVTDTELAARKTSWMTRETKHASDALWKFAQQVGPAVAGAVTHPGGAHEKQCYADI